MGKELKNGEKAPEFELPDHEGKNVSLDDFRGKWRVVYFYPKDDTPGCTVEAIDFTKSINDFNKMNAIVIGISADSVESHCKFIEKHKLGIVLLSDKDKKAIEEYGVWGLKSFMGKTFYGIKRSTFLINPNGRLSKAWYNVKAAGHADDVLKALRDIKK